MKLVVKPLERYGSLNWITSTIPLNKYFNFVSEDHFSEMQKHEILCMDVEPRCFGECRHAKKYAYPSNYLGGASHFMHF